MNTTPPVAGNTATTSANQSNNSPDVMENGIKLVGELVVPGASQMMNGKVASGLGHLFVAGIAAAVLAPVSPLMAGLVAIGVRANSFSESVNKKNLVTTLTGGK